MNTGEQTWSACKMRSRRYFFTYSLPQTQDSLRQLKCVKDKDLLFISLHYPFSKEVGLLWGDIFLADSKDGLGMQIQGRTWGRAIKNALQRKEVGNQSEGEKDQVKGAGTQRGSLAVGKHQGERSTTLCRSNGEEGTSGTDRLGENSSRWLCGGQCNPLLLPCHMVFRENCIPHSSFYLFIYF